MIGAIHEIRGKLIAVLVVGVAAMAAMGIMTMNGVFGGVASARAVAAPFVLHLQIRTGAMTHRSGWPRYLANGRDSARIVLPAHRVIKVILTSPDTGSAPVVAAEARTMGLSGGEVINGVRTMAVPANRVAHTFTVAALGVNVVVPVASARRPETIVAYFRTGAPGVYTWQCMAPCGTGSTGWGGPMTTPGYMMGQIVVKA